MKKALVALLIIIPVLTFSQTSSPFAAFENLIGGRWVTNGKFESGAKFHQAKEHTWELTKHIIIVKTYDFVDANQFDNSLRNYGVRCWDSINQKINFYEFNSFDKMTSGECVTEGKNIYYNYDYSPAGSDKVIKLTDAWIFIDKNTYAYKIGVYKDGKWERVFLSSMYRREAGK